MSANWRKRCRQCGGTPARGRAWCPKCLRRVSRGLPTDLDSIPSPREGYEPGPDFDPLPLAHRKRTMVREGGDGSDPASSTGSGV